MNVKKTKSSKKIVLKITMSMTILYMEAFLSHECRTLNRTFPAHCLVQQHMRAFCNSEARSLGGERYLAVGGDNIS